METDIRTVMVKLLTDQNYLHYKPKIGLLKGGLRQGLLK